MITAGLVLGLLFLLLGVLAFGDADSPGDHEP
jgi:hypothetical protein